LLYLSPVALVTFLEAKQASEAVDILYQKAAELFGEGRTEEAAAVKAEADEKRKDQIKTKIMNAGIGSLEAYTMTRPGFISGVGSIIPL
jgi:hypothetical protein